MPGDAQRPAKGGYTEDLVERFAHQLAVDPDDGKLVIGYGDVGEPLWGDPIGEARRLLDWLAAEGRLVPEGSETQWAYRNAANTPIPADSETAVRAAAVFGTQAMYRLVTPWFPAVPAEKGGDRG